MPSNTYGGTARPASHTFTADQQPSPETCQGDLDDDLLATVLIRMWTLASGRSLRRDVPPAQLSAEELIEFWADDMNQPAGRHALPEAQDRTANAREPSRKARPTQRRRGRNRHHSSDNARGARQRSAA